MLNPTADRRTPTRLATAAIAGLLALATLPAAAARTGGNEPRPLEGSVYDASGAVLPGVELALEADGKVVFETTTDGAGYFTFPIVEPGRYVLRVSQAGFRSLRQELTLADGRDWNRAITLQVGDVRESIVVREQRPERATPETTAAPAPVRVGGNLRPPRKLVDVKPVYPATMRDAGREGVVPIEATIARDGSVDSARVLTAQVHPDFAIAAVEAVKQWRFDPTLLNGVPVEVVMRVTVEFELSD